MPIRLHRSGQKDFAPGNVFPGSLMCFKFFFWFFLITSVSCAEELTLEQAIESTLNLQANIISGKLDADAATSAVEGSRGPFDPVLSSSAVVSSAQTPLNMIERDLYRRDLLESDLQTYALTVNKLTRSGIGFETTAGFSGVKDVSSASSRYGESAATIGVAVNFPIFDLLMENIYTTNEKIAIENSRAVLNRYFYQASTSIYQTVLNYWSYLAAYERLLILRSIEQNTAKMLSDFEKLVENRERPRSDAIQIQANLAVKHGQVVNGEKNLAVLGFELAKSMGVPYDGNSLLSPKEGRWVDILDPETLSADERISDADKNRFDIKSIESINRIAELMIDSSKRGLKPDLNFFVSADYSDKGAHVPGELFDNAKTVKTGLVFTTPLQNRSARSDVALKEINLRRRALDLADARRRAAFEVASSVNELKQNLKAYQFSLNTAALYRESLRVEEEKLKHGMSTVIDVLNTRENYQNALVARIENLRMVAASMAGVLYATGEIVTIADQAISVDVSALYSLHTN